MTAPYSDPASNHAAANQANQASAADSVDGTTADSRRPRLAAALVSAAVVVALVVAAFVAFRWGSPGTPSAGPTTTPTPTPTGNPTTAQIYEALAPSVVTIEKRAPGTNQVRATGTGVVANADGVILTAYHVVAGDGDIRVVFADGTPSAATIVAADPEIDVAALTVSTLPELLVPAVLGGGVAVGDTVIAIGNQLGLTRSTTEGVVSGLDRGATGNDGSTLAGLIQFDAAVNPGSSGGPLVNARGETVGIVVALANPTEADTFIGIGFAVPIGAAVAAGRGNDPGPMQ